MRNVAPQLSSLGLSTFSRPLNPRNQGMLRLDSGLKALFPLLFAALVILGVSFGSFEAYLGLLSRQTYTAFLPALAALEVAELYRRRWQFELFFKWIKQHLKIKAFYGTSKNAVLIQI